MLIANAAQPVGRTLALTFAELGWRIGLHCPHSTREARQLAAEIVGRGAAAAVLEADLADRAQVARLIAACAAALGAPTCLINNAALRAEDNATGPDAEVWDALQAVIVKAPAILAPAFAAALPTGTTGNIVNIVDLRAWRPPPLLFSYATSQMVLWSLTRTLAQALAPRVRVNAVAPGPVGRGEAGERIPGRDTTAEEIVRAIRYILDAPAMTGQTIALDGGWPPAWDAPDLRPAPRRPSSLMSANQPDTPQQADAPDIIPAGPRRVFVQDLEIVASIGIYEHEKRYEQRVLISADLWVRDDYDGRSDRLTDVLDYSKVVDDIERLVQSGHVNLIETLAERIARQCLSDRRVERVRVRIEKPDVARSFKSVGIEIERRRKAQ
jgi:dihydroneopterin aldolase